MQTNTQFACIHRNHIPLVVAKRAEALMVMRKHLHRDFITDSTQCRHRLAEQLILVQSVPTVDGRAVSIPPSEERWEYQSHLGGKSVASKMLYAFPYDILFIARSSGYWKAILKIETIQIANAFYGQVVTNINALCRNVERVPATRQSARWCQETGSALCMLLPLFSIDYSTPRSSRNSLMRSSAS